MQKNAQDIVLVMVNGFDSPGITAKLTSIIASAQGVHILDIEQTVVHKKLILSILLKFNQGRNEKTSVLKELLFCGNEFGVKVGFEAFSHQLLDSSHHYRYAITCLGKEVDAKPLSQISAVLAKRKVNIAKISKLAQKNLSCVELLVESKRRLNYRDFSKELLALTAELSVDIAMQPADLSRRAKRMVVMDMDSTLVSTEAIDELARAAGKYKQVQAITKQAMNGKLDFNRSLQRRVALLKGLPEKSLEKAVKNMQLNRGAKRLIKVLNHLGYHIGVVSGGFTQFTDHLAKTLKLDFSFANQLEIKAGKLTGNVTGTIINAEGKARILESMAKSRGISTDQVIAIGDGANDLQMLSCAGMGIAFHAKDIVRKQAHTTIGKHAGLDSILYLLGISEHELKGMV